MRRHFRPISTFVSSCRPLVATRPAAFVLAALVAGGCGMPTDPVSAPEIGVPRPELAVSTSPGGITYYVSPSGNDKKAGTSPSTAWRTISKVNNKNFAPDDRILFEGGATFAGTLKFDAKDQGSATDPIEVASYGTGRAIISAGSADGIKLYNTAGFEIRNLKIVGAGATSNTGSGITAYADLAGNVKLDYLVVDTVEVSGFGKYGVVVGSWNNNTGFANVRVTNSVSHDNALAGFSAYAQLPYSHQNLYFGHLKAYRNTGVAGLTRPSGSGIVMGGVSGGTVERSIAYGNGALCDASGGPYGIWTYDSERILIQHNESYANRTNGPTDGGGFDLDQNTRYTTVQYNYSHGNDGPGILLAHAPNNTNHTGNVVRYNISENDSRNNSNGAITVWGRIQNTEIYNNTVYVTPSSTGTPRAMYVHNASITSSDVAHLHVRNNTLYSTGGVRVIEVTASQLSGATDFGFEGNDYFGGGLSPKLVWGSTTYTSLDSWQAATGQETVAGAPVGYEGDPGLASPGNGGTVGDADRLSSLTAYRLVSGSPLIDRALNLVQTFGLAPGPADFFSNPLPYGSGFDVGAHEWR